MHTIDIQNTIQKIMAVYRKFGIWHSGDTPTCKETNMKLFYSIYHLLAPISFLSGAFITDSWEESILLVDATILTIVSLVKLWYLIWNKTEIVEMVECLGTHSIKDRETYTAVDRKMKIFIKFVNAFLSATIILTCFVVCVPFLRGERQLFFNIGFPLDWKNNDIAYFITLTFLLLEGLLALVSVSFSVLVWYLLLNCSLKYDNLASKLKTLGDANTVDETPAKREGSVQHIENFYRQDLIEGIEFHKDITK